MNGAVKKGKITQWGLPDGTHGRWARKSNPRTKDELEDKHLDEGKARALRLPSLDLNFSVREWTGMVTSYCPFPQNHEAFFMELSTLQIPEPCAEMNRNTKQYRAASSAPFSRGSNAFMPCAIQ